ncbi:glycosyltransferase [Caulobacter sp. S45]|uniref:glycosyltransferase n=1 Tax=Caulobacter sp. S45 TaxID=1641861 RepID=UPI001575D00B|nr:glycosyltransferase [Caulobacter sp. S45]
MTQVLPSTHGHDVVQIGSEAVPSVSIIIANYNAAEYLPLAVKSALRQTFSDIEVVIVDDVSTDDSVAVSETLMSDPRVRLLRQERNAGPGAARNRGFAAARGDWIAVLDSDDLMHPRRIELLLREAKVSGADIVADDLLVFYQDGEHSPHSFLRRSRHRGGGKITLADYFWAARLYSPTPQLGFLKPMFRTQALRRNGLNYDEGLLIGEDADLIMRSLAEGLSYHLSSLPTYLYRKHKASISHRLEVRHVAALQMAVDRLAPPSGGKKLARAMRAYRRSLVEARAYGEAVDALKARDIFGAARALAAAPTASRLMGLPVSARLERLFMRAKPAFEAADGQKPAMVIVSRQRLVGATNGSSAYLLGLCKSLSRAGYTLHLIQPSPAVFGRWPVLRMRAEMAVFARHHLRGASRLGNVLICTNPAVWLQATREVGARALRRAGLPSAFLSAVRAPYAIAAPWTAADLIFTARHSPQGAAAVLADYAFQTEVLPYVIGAGTSAVVMHDLFSARQQQFADRAAADATTTLERAEEIALLRMADFVLAIQKDEANAVAEDVRPSVTLVIPMGVKVRDRPQPGTGRQVLFVGSNAAPNVIGLTWFLAEVMPLVRRAMPEAELVVAGSVARAFDSAPPSVRFLGVVDSLEPIYASAAVVISPLTVGSGLKIKLVEAMAQGKAIVATSVTLQGFDPEVTRGAVICVDDAEAYATAVLDLLASPQAREGLGANALRLAADQFGEAAASAPLVEALRRLHLATDQ